MDRKLPNSELIFHIARESEFRAQLDHEAYRPGDLGEVGFVHCATSTLLLPVAEAVFSAVSDPLVLLEIDPASLSSELRYEPAAPIPGADPPMAEAGAKFPHIYGPVSRGAIRRVGTLLRTPGGFGWPTDFARLAEFLSRPPRMH